ncbi:hypothetical protein NYE40_23970 [Paenibacillus sp. FSL W8-1187]|uniref:hypothetical protein n=1 Tax=Paenibacillus sp. FSL W8-1187 TaxID=2975339 RepID=UPI0030D77C81
MELSLAGNPQLLLAFEMLADMIVSYHNKQQRRHAPSEVRDVVFSITESEFEQQMNEEMTAELLQTTDYRMIA